MSNPIVTMETTAGTMKIELYPDVAPNTVNNFISLVQKGFYDGLIFHRVIPGFMISGRRPGRHGLRRTGLRHPRRICRNRFNNPLKHTRGVLSMARSQHPDSAGFAVFIMVDDAPHLDGQYAAFGKVIEGMEAADAIVSARRNRMDKPFEDQKMIKVTVETFGVDYPQPETC